MKAKNKSSKRSAQSAVIPETGGALFMDKREVARRLGLKPRTIGVWALQQKIPAFRFGRFVRFKWDEVEQALAANFRVATRNAETLKTEKLK
jgi:excisionase family DNA binding protein